MKHIKKWEDVLELISILLLVLLINILAARYFFRFDLTEEKRYTISEASKRILQNLDDQVYVEVYLTGELNASFKQLERSIKETLESFKVYAGEQLVYRFIDIEQINDPRKRQQLYKNLAKKGLPPTQLYEVIKGKKIQKTIVPGVVISHQGKEQGVLLLKGNKASKPQDQLAQSIENVEYELISTIQQLNIKRKPLIAFLDGSDVLRPQDVVSFFKEMSEQYIVERVNLNTRNNLNDYDAIILAQPKKPLSNIQRYRIDQFIMNGGKALFFIDKVQMNIDSIAINGTYAFGYELNLEDMLFRYGVRINLDLVQDQQAGALLINVGKFGDKPNLQAIPFPYYPIMNTFSKHPIVKNLDAVYGRFVSTIDTVKAKSIRKTPLIFTSKYTKIKKCPNMVELNELRKEFDISLYKKSHIPIAYLLEGEFKSAYHFPLKNEPQQAFRKVSEDTKILVVADGDFLRNDISRRQGKPLPLGYDEVMRRSFDNAQVIKNALSYMLDEQGIITSRNQEIKMRPLDKPRIQKERLLWQLFNIVLPVSLVVVFGFFMFWWRRQRWSKPHQNHSKD